MSRPPRLQWEPARSKWKVVYRGKKYRFDGGSGKSDRAAKQRAEKAWRAKKAEIDHTAELTKPHRVEYENVISEWTEVLTWAVDHGDDATATVARSKIRDLENRLGESIPVPLAWADRFFAGPPPLYDENKRLQDVPLEEEGIDQSSIVSVPVPIEHTYYEGNEHLQGVPLKEETYRPLIMSGPVPFEHTLWKDRLEAQKQRLDQVEGDDTFAANVEAFLQTKRSEVSAGQLSAVRADSLRIYLDTVMTYAGKNSSVSRIDAVLFSNFRNYLLGRIAKKEISAYHARDVFSAFKLFTRWLANNTDKLESLPRNIDDKRLNISISKQKAKTLTATAIKTLLEEATDRTRLYLLLGLNCAMTQQDMSDLQPSEVNWKSGIISRKRSKTGDFENVPEVAYRLWPWTMELLKQEQSSSAEHVLLTRDGNSLRFEEIQANNKFKKNDAVRLAIRRLKTKAGIEVTMKMLKKTSASLLRNNRHYQGLESLFLGHAPTSVADRHYTAVPQDLMDEAIAWLAEELKVEQVWRDIKKAAKEKKKGEKI